MQRITSTQPFGFQGNESDDGEERHVGFFPEVHFTEREGRLRRRDTPHHLKNKRVDSKANAEDQLKHIMAQVSKKSTSSEHSSMNNDSVRQLPWISPLFCFLLF